MFKPSSFQQAIFHEVEYSTDNLVIEAVAGSGKTTTIIEALKLLKDRKVLFLAFNKAIADTLKDRVPANVEACTLNSYGFKACMKGLNKKFIKVDPNKTTAILRFEVMKIKESSSKEEKALYYKTASTIKRLISLAKANNIPKPTRNDWDNLICDYDLAEVFQKLNENESQLFYQNLDTTFTRCINCTSVLDFDDQLFFPVYYNWPIPCYDVVMIDECQDLNPIQIELIKRLQSA